MESEIYEMLLTEPWKEEANQSISEAYEFFDEARKRPERIVQLYDSDPARYLEHTKSAEEAWQRVSRLEEDVLRVTKELAINGIMIATHLHQSRSEIDTLWDLPQMRSQTKLRKITSLGDFSVGSYGCESIMRIVRFYKTYQELDEDTYCKTLEDLNQRRVEEEE